MLNRRDFIVRRMRVVFQKFYKMVNDLFWYLMEINLRHNQHSHTSPQTVQSIHKKKKKKVL